MRAYLLFVKQNFALLSFGFLCVFWGNFGQSFFLGWYGDAIKTGLNISAQTYGAIYSFATLCSAMVVIWVGAWIDHWPLKRYVIVVAIGLFFACSLLAVAQSVWVLAVAFFTVRLFGQALMPHTGITTMAREFNTNRGKAMSLATSGVPVGEVVLPLLAVALIQSIGWQISWWVIAATVPTIFLPLILLCLRGRAPSHEGSAASKPKASSGRALLFKDYRFWLALPTLLATPFVLTALFIHQGFLLEQKSWSPALMATAFVVYGAAHWLSSMVYGVLVDRFSGLQLFRFYTLPLLVALLLLANFDGAWVAIVMMLCLAGTIGASGVVASAMWAEIYGPEYLGAIRASVSGLAVFSTALSPYLIGVLIDFNISLWAISNSLAAYVALALILLVWSYRKPVFT